MEKDNVKESETEINTEEKEENINSELQDLIEDHEEEVDSKENNKSSFGKTIFASFLDQLIILAGSSVILLIADLIMRMFGYQFVRENGVLLLAVMYMYFFINCFYIPLMERTKLKNTIAKKILNL